MILDGLIPLHGSMQTQSISRYKFEYAHGRGRFDVFQYSSQMKFHLSC